MKIDAALVFFIAQAASFAAPVWLQVAQKS